MVSMVAGKYAGVYKGARVVVIKTARGGEMELSLSSGMIAHVAVIADIARHNVVGGVMSMSFGFVPPGANPFPRLLAYTASKNIVSVIAAGNTLAVDLATNSPQQFGGSANPNIIVVGCAAPNGKRWEAFDGISGSTWRNPTGDDILSVYAMGMANLAAGISNDNMYAIGTGTSGAAAQVAGIAAFHMVHGGLDAPDVKARLVSEAVALKGMGWAVDDPRFPAHPRVGLKENMVPCDPTEATSTAGRIIPRIVRAVDGASAVVTVAPFITNTQEVSSICHDHPSYS